MKNHRLPRRFLSLLTLAVAYFWLFSPDLFKDCIHVVLCAVCEDAVPDRACGDAVPDCTCGDAVPDRACGDAAPDCTCGNAAPDRALTEEEYRDLFRLEKSEYKVTWKFFRKD